MKIAITGGHHNSALAVIDELEKLGKYELLWFGHRHSVWGDKNDSAEYKEVTARGIPFVDLKAGKLYKTYNPRKLIRLPRGFFNAFYHLFKFRPNLLLSFGGYLAPPAASAAWILGIPIFTHEQTAVAGWSNFFVAQFAKKVFITWPESARFFPKKKVTVVGLPLRKEILRAKKEISDKQSGRTVAGRPRPMVVYITGGKQGSNTINEVVKETLPQLLKEFKVIHQCGAVSFLDSKKQMEKVVSLLPLSLQKNYQVRDYFFSKDLAKILKKVDIVICRGGAHTIYEMAYLGKPCIVIPIPWVSHNEQFKNAQILRDAATSLILEERYFTPQELFKTCHDIKNNFRDYKKNALALSQTIEENAAYKIAQEISKI